MWQEIYRAQIEALVQAAHKFYRLRYQMGDGGNLSVRVPDAPLMIVKGTDVSFEEVSAQTLVLCDFDGNVQGGALRPSKEALLHGALYRSLPEIGAVMHCHSPWATAWAAGHEELALSTHHAGLKFSHQVPVFDTHSYAVPKEFFPQITAYFQANPQRNAFLLRMHGQVTMAKDMRKAAYLAELVEETAQIAILSGLHPGPKENRTTLC